MAHEPPVKPTISADARRPRATLRGHFQICRVDHWIKNVFVLPGIVVALSVQTIKVSPWLPLHIVIGLLATGLVASSNYVLNEILDAPYDRLHPTKHLRPVPSGRVNIPLAYVQWLALMVAGLGLGLLISVPLTVTLAGLWIMGPIYNVPPLRSKDLAYVDVLSESINNPLRMLAGWYIVASTQFPPASLLMAYWMIGCYFMGLKRFAEFRIINDAARAAAYRKSFAHYTEARLLSSISFYGSAAMLFFGIFLMRYRLELVLSFPLVALFMAVYMQLSFKRNSAVQAPENLWREPLLVATVGVCCALMVVLLFVDVPVLQDVFEKTPWRWAH
ncbi:MAG: UbiA prenyltransferase family protein [Proteobacteria bacterium]|nr:UbiA prenyltransferase family protein [Pseudomonadota bacterium]MBU1740637.1 UbiA prenyltransferase family protein [Pseudomonadota bacterium]